MATLSQVVKLPSNLREFAAEREAPVKRGRRSLRSGIAKMEIADRGDCRPHHRRPTWRARRPRRASPRSGVITSPVLAPSPRAELTDDISAAPCAKMLVALCVAVSAELSVRLSETLSLLLSAVVSVALSETELGKRRRGRDTPRLVLCSPPSLEPHAPVPDDRRLHQRRDGTLQIKRHHRFREALRFPRVLQPEHCEERQYRSTFQILPIEHLR